MRGNVVDLAVGVIIGGAFGKIVSSLVADVIMPFIGILSGGIDFKSSKLILKDAIPDVSPAVTLNYGMFIQSVVDFLIVAIAIFAMIKLLNSFNKEEPEVPAGPPELTGEEKLLVEIRDLLKQK